MSANASRLGEQFFGRVGNLEKVGKDILSSLPQTGGILGWGISKLIGQERWERMIKGQGQILPTSEQLKELSQEVTKGYTKPKTKGEEHFQKYIEDVGSTIGGRPLNLRNIAVNNLGIPLASNVVQDVIEELGFGKNKGLIGKLGSWTFLSLLGNVNAPRYASDLMNQGRNGIPQNVNFNTPRLLNRLDNVDRNLLSADPRTALAREQIANIRRDLSNGQTSVRSLMNTYDGTNSAKRNRGLFDFNRDDKKFARKSIDNDLHAVKDEIIDSGINHPEAINSWKDGLQAWAVIHQSRNITNTIESWARGPYAKIIAGPTAALFGITSYGAIKAPLFAIPASIAIPSAYKSLQTGYRVLNDKNLSRYYWNSISAAQRENAAAFINNFLKIKDDLEKSPRSTVKNKSNRND